MYNFNKYVSTMSPIEVVAVKLATHSLTHSRCVVGTSPIGSPTRRECVCAPTSLRHFDGTHCTCSSKVY